MSIKYVICKNCERTFKDEYNFCPYCGQDDKQKLTLGVLFYNTISNYFSVDARFFKSFIPLIAKPGYLASKFVEGRRLLYLHPAQMYLFITVIFFFLFSFIQRQQIQNLNNELEKSLRQEKMSIHALKTNDSLLKAEQEKQKQEDSIINAELKKVLTENKKYTRFSDSKIDSIVSKTDTKKQGIFDFDFNESKMDSLIDIGASNEVIYKFMGMNNDAGYFTKRLYSQALKFYKSREGGSILGAFYDTIPIAMFFLLPIFALILMLLYRKKGTYAYHLVFSFYFFAFLFTVFSIIIVVNFIVDIPDGIDWLIAISTFFYLCLALSRFYNQGKFKSFIKGFIASFLFLSFVAPATAMILGIFAFLFY
ncbi:DUF3667 domain-containing protein [Confluentibacter flavum]|uniref:DUF3667 domain-containing protein n=1 Tax=Confluentibacter flavum TaxID=1909700 RepID=A0A2N3HGJ2_9FLAO|nr:DUF3667 domain-containing protein [Confluentibacter flavum]PKQ44090.1 hypothetical protein CSW08_14915 [Confluentibacter flavum]